MSHNEARNVGVCEVPREGAAKVFDGIQTVLFLVSASCFDLVVREDEATNRLQESIKIFQNVWVSRFLKDAGFIVFLNKQDILKDKVVNSKKHIGDYFPNYADYKLDVKDQDPPHEEPKKYKEDGCFIRGPISAFSLFSILSYHLLILPFSPPLPVVLFLLFPCRLSPFSYFPPLPHLLSL
ncbi:Guanine nucleotide-binding protein G(s) subunit alpha isoform [Penaeus vannamei]|uniref:Guanine nucleotide-binding protein G(S) subunit alpha isoform n=1 Tax=Penaeus vannamei TaxID=6689 RepID=A0A423U4T5_PENVA|nr:Guanine nucleotide-binding protein G(s) subunit alpha isoform [Penaeus vannamei]